MNFDTENFSDLYHRLPNNDPVRKQVNEMLKTRNSEINNNQIVESRNNNFRSNFSTSLQPFKNKTNSYEDFWNEQFDLFNFSDPFQKMKNFHKEFEKSLSNSKSENFRSYSKKMEVRQYGDKSQAYYESVENNNGNKNIMRKKLYKLNNDKVEIISRNNEPEEISGNPEILNHFDQKYIQNN